MKKIIQFFSSKLELSETLKVIYKDRVINGSRSLVEWPPRVMSVKALPHSIRQRHVTNKKRLGKSGAKGTRRGVVSASKRGLGVKKTSSKRRTRR